MRKLELFILRDLSERLYNLLLKFDVSLIRYWLRNIQKYLAIESSVPYQIYSDS